MFRRLLSGWLDTLTVNKIQSLKIEDDELLFIQLPDDVSHAAIDAFRKGIRKQWGEERSFRTIIHVGEIKLKKVNMKDNQIDQILLGGKE